IDAPRCEKGRLPWPSPRDRRCSGTSAVSSSPCVDSHRRRRARRPEPRTCTNRRPAYVRPDRFRVTPHRRRLLRKRGRRLRWPRERGRGLGLASAFVAGFFSKDEEFIQNLLRQLVVLEQVAFEIGHDELALGILL